MMSSGVKSNRRSSIAEKPVELPDYAVRGVP
jgi:hypothetical protein